MSKSSIDIKPEVGHGSFKSYVTGFGLSLVLTLLAYILVVDGSRPANTIIAAIIVLAVMQLFVQLYFFLHLARESKPRWNLTALLFAALVVGIVVIGSLWIMRNLNYSHQHGNDRSPSDASRYIVEDELIKN